MLVSIPSPLYMVFSILQSVLGRFISVCGLHSGDWGIDCVRWWAPNWGRSADLTLGLFCSCHAKLEQLCVCEVFISFRGVGLRKASRSQKPPNRCRLSSAIQYKRGILVLWFYRLKIGNNPWLISLINFRHIWALFVSKHNLSKSFTFWLPMDYLD